jgi:hypothetical protein
LVSGLAFILRERLLAVGKIVLPRLPYGKAVAVASLLLEKFPTNKETKRYYDSARPRWMRDFSFRINPYCPVSKLFALTGLLQPEMTKELLATHDQGLLVDIGANSLDVEESDRGASHRALAPELRAIDYQPSSVRASCQIDDVLPG